MQQDGSLNPNHIFFWNVQCSPCHCCKSDLWLSFIFQKEMPVTGGADSEVGESVD